MDKVEPQRAVRIRYAMRTHLRDGTVKDRHPETHEFIYGIDRQVPSLERVLDGAMTGGSFRVTIPPGEIYGEHDPALIAEIPKKGLIKTRLKKGQYYRRMKQGCLVSFKVLEVKEDTVLADFNKPMAGISVTVEGEVLDIREATQQEIEAASEAQIRRSIGCG